MTDTTIEFDRNPQTTATDGEADEQPFVCSYCTRPFAHEEWLVLHRGLEHEDELTDAERAAFVETYQAEEEDLRLFRLKALIVLILVYFGFIIIYAFFTVPA